MLRKLVLLALLPACVAGSSNISEGEDERAANALTSSQKRAVSDRIKAVAATWGSTNPLLFAGIPHHETGLVHCWKDATWACQGPYSSSCGGPVIAGSGDGPCSYQQGGLGMYQFDAGTYAQTLATYGNGVLTLDGNIDQGVRFIVNKVRTCPNGPRSSSDADAIAWLNTARPGTARFEQFMGVMAYCYNGCAPGASYCNHEAVKGLYRSATIALYDMFGDAYWYGATPVASASTFGRRVGRNADGRLEVFARGESGDLIHAWQSGVNEGFGAFRSFGGYIQSDPVVANNADGRLEVFVRGGDDAIWHVWQTAPSSGWDDWSYLGGNTIYEPAIAANADGRLELFAVGADHVLRHRWQLEPNGGWSPYWADLASGVISDPAVGRNADGRLEVFAIGADGALHQAWQQADGWSAWTYRGGSFASSPAVASNADGRLEVFALGADGRAWHTWQTAPNSGWSNIVPLDGATFATRRTFAVSPGLMLFGRASDGGLAHLAQSASGWNAWPFDGDAASDPAFATNLDGRVELFLRGSDGVLRHRWQTTPGGSWSGWNALGAVSSF